MSAAEVKAALAEGEDKRPNKFGNRRTSADGIQFDSAHEAREWGELRLRERLGQVRNLRRQIPYTFEHMSPFGDTVTICTYRADFVFEEFGADGKWREVVADAKGFETPVWKIKRNLMRAYFGIEVRAL
jgi:hypothetical protein